MIPEKEGFPELPGFVGNRTDYQLLFGRENRYKRFSIPITDQRLNPNTAQQESLKLELEKEKIDIVLQIVKEFLGKYSANSPEDMSIEIVDGELGWGTINDKKITLSLPQPDVALKDLQAYFEDLSPKEITELVSILITSIALHEAVHGLLNSKPKSSFAVDFERISAIPNTNGHIATLLDSGIAYAIQGIFVPYESIAPIPKPDDDEVLKVSKSLGEELKPMVKNYLEKGQSLDNVFFIFAGQIMKYDDLTQYLAACEERSKRP